MAVPYVRLLSRRRVALPFACAFVARLPIAMTPLGTVVLIADVRGSYTSAGLVTGAFALATAISAPLWGGLMDRVGQPRVIAGTALSSAAMLVALALITVAGAPIVALVAAAALVGITFPPVNPAMRVAWSTIVPDESERRSAYALDAASVETLFVLGPLVLTALLAGPAALPLLVTAGLMAVGGIGYSRTYAARAWRPLPAAEAGTRGGSPLRSAGAALTLVTGLAMAVGFGQLDVAITATAERIFHSEAILGVFFACVAGGSTVGGLWYGSRRWPGRERLRLPFTLVAFAAGMGVLALVLTADGRPALGILLPTLVLTGLAISPGLIIQQALVDEHAAPDRRSEAQGWLTTGLTAGSAAGMAVAGVLVDRAGPASAFAGGAVALVVAAVVAVVAQRWWRERVASIAGAEARV